jgi:hypothetical protein
MPLFYTYQKNIHRKQAFFIHITKTCIENSPFFSLLNPGGLLHNGLKLPVIPASTNINNLIISHLQGANSKRKFSVSAFYFSVLKQAAPWKHQVSKKII